MPTLAGALTICLPIADRPRAMAFYRDALDLDAIGTPTEDGVPEPLQFQLDHGTRLMLIPTGGFGWVLDGREVAPSGVSECVLSLAVPTEREVDDVVERIRSAGGEVIAEPDRQPWGYTATGADPDGHVWQVLVAETDG